MAHSVIILGAGASVEAGAPLMWNFLDAAEDLLTSGDLHQDDAPHFQRVFQARAQLRSVHSWASLDLDNIESLFAVFETGKLLGRIGTLDQPGQHQELIDSLKRVIVVTLEKTIKYPMQDGTWFCPPPYDYFVGTLVDILKGKQHSIDLITFNYDLALDHGLRTHQIDPKQPGLTPGPHQRGVKVSRNLPLSLFKLHGSLNWYREGEHTVAADIGYIQMQPSPNPSAIRLSPKTFYNFPVTSTLNHRSKEPRVPLIAPPTWNKSEYHATLKPIWQEAAKSLQRATNIFVTGYSLPPSDHFFRHLYALGVDGPTTLRRFWVFDPQINRGVGDRFLELLGPSARSRYAGSPMTFREAIPVIGRALTDGITSPDGEQSND